MEPCCMVGVSLKVFKAISKNLPFKSFQKPDHAPDADDLDECFSRGSGNFVVLGEPACVVQPGKDSFHNPAALGNTMQMRC